MVRSLASRSPSRVPATLEGVRYRKPMCGQCRIEFGEEQARVNMKTQTTRYLGQWVCRIHHLGEKVADGSVLGRRARRRVMRQAASR